MKKRFLSLALALVICLSLLPTMAMAENELPATLEAPSAIYIRDDAWIGESGKPEVTSLWVSFNKGADLGQLLTVMYDYDFGEYYGVDDWHLQIKAQLDWSLDDQNHWQYRPYWDWGVNAHEDDVNILPGEYTTINLNPDTTQEEQFFSLGTTENNWGGDDDWASRIPASAYTLFTYTADDEAYYRPVIDWNEHTLYVRMRFLIRYNEIGDENYKFIFSPWSAVASFGKGAVTYKQPTSLEAPTVSGLKLADYEFNGGPVFLYQMVNPQSVKDHSGGAPSIGDRIRLETQVNIGGTGWVDVQGAGDISDGERDAKLSTAAKKVDETTWVQLRTRYHYCADSSSGRSDLYSAWSNVVEMGAPAWGNVSQWAEEWMAKASELGIIPDCLKGADMTRQINRAEFAAVCVKLYEALTGETLTAAAVNPFQDTGDAEVLKALNAGITKGTGDGTTFSPTKELTRQECATMLARVYKKVALAGWTLDTDSQFNQQFQALFTMPALFADDGQIDGWAKDSVYFMKAKGIINGVGDGSKFAPKQATAAGEAAGYGLATRQEALKIAVAMVDTLK